ncbi:MAG: hypothetical protein HRT83_05595, partial [Hyphomicrobiaceae bacterium]|nr:hypothetical protein [Hyphomicrobiaceae bacterium]
MQNKIKLAFRMGYKDSHLTRSDCRLPYIYRGPDERTLSGVYIRDHSGERGKWLISTCIAAVVGTLVIAVVIIGSLDTRPSLNQMISQIYEAKKSTGGSTLHNHLFGGLNWSIPKSDKLQFASGALSARYTIHEQVNMQRNNRPFIKIRSYIRIVARLASASSANAEFIPRFNPLGLYATKADENNSSIVEENGHKFGRIEVRIIDPLPLTFYDQQAVSLGLDDVKSIVRYEQRILRQLQGINMDQVGNLPTKFTLNYLSDHRVGISLLGQIGSNLTELHRNAAIEIDKNEDIPPGEVRVVKVGKGDSVIRILQKMGSPNWHAGNMVNAANTVIGMNKISPGQEIHVHMVESVTKPGLLEPSGFSLFGLAHNHLVTVKRNETGEFEANAEIDQETLLKSMNAGTNHWNLNTLYAAIYDAGLTQNLDPSIIQKILRIHAYSIDFRRKLSNGDQIELIFELRKQPNGKTKLGELFHTVIKSGGETSEFWRFRSSDGTVDYYDEKGNNSK